MLHIIRLELVEHGQMTATLTPSLRRIFRGIQRKNFISNPMRHATGIHSFGQDFHEERIFLAHNILGRDNKYICRVIIPFNNNSSWSVSRGPGKSEE